MFCWISVRKIDQDFGENIQLQFLFMNGIEWNQFMIKAKMRYYGNYQSQNETAVDISMYSVDLTNCFSLQ